MLWSPKLTSRLSSYGSQAISSIIRHLGINPSSLGLMLPQSICEFKTNVSELLSFRKKICPFSNPIETMSVRVGWHRSTVGLAPMWLISTDYKRLASKSIILNSPLDWMKKNMFGLMGLHYACTTCESSCVLNFTFSNSMSQITRTLSFVACAIIEGSVGHQQIEVMFLSAKVSSFTSWKVFLS